MAYEKTPWADGATALSAANMNKIEQGIFDAHERIDNLIERIIEEKMLEKTPVGSLKMTAENINPGTYLGGTWIPWGQGRVPVGVDTSQTEFDTKEKTGGRKDSVVPYHNHTFTGNALPVHNHTQNSHNHSQNQHMHGANSSNINPDQRFVTVNKYDTFSNDAGGGISGSGYTYPRLKDDGSGFLRPENTGYATATNNPQTATNNAASAGTPTGNIGFAGTSGNNTNSNLQPYITCYMWKRTA